jgi:hypothetical protein
MFAMPLIRASTRSTRRACRFQKRRGGYGMANVIWTILVILFVFWLIGLVAHIGGSLINILIVLVVIGVIYNLLTGRRAV